ncbi:MAG: PEP-CTERM sorting domain-containing protein [Planctomycetes bacterium]|nr:PEP-CTERM sorting domain-containing protein [Planctomycetota bacterium]
MMKPIALTRLASLIVLAVCASFVPRASAIMVQYQGSWFNNTFMSTGAAAATLDVSLPTVTFVLDLDGNVFGGSDPDVLTLTGTVQGDLSVLFDDVIGHPTYGDILGATLSNTGQFNATATNIPGGFITSTEITGLAGLSGIALQYIVDGPNGPFANGVINMLPIPEPTTAAIVLLGAGAMFRRRR